MHDAAPRGDCLGPATSSLRAENRTPARKHGWKWRWKGGLASLADLGNPTAATNYALCVYAQAGAETIGMSSGAAWRRAGSGGFAFASPGVPAGARRARINVDSKGALTATVSGTDMQLGAAPAPRLTSPVIVQLLLGDSARCVSTFYAADGATRDDAQRLFMRSTSTAPLP